MTPRVPADEAGFSLVELLVVISLLTIALVMFGSTLFAVQNSARTQERIGSVTDDLGIALSELERYGRSAYWVRDLALEGADDAVEMLTVDGVGQDLCVAWKVADGALWMRRGSAAAWRQLASGVVNADLAVEAFDAGRPVLVFDPANVGARIERDSTLEVTLFASVTDGDDPVQLGTLITARNVLRGAADPC